MEYILTYHDIHYLDSTFLIEETIEYVMNEVRDVRNILVNDLQVTKDYNQNATSRLDVDLIITDLEGSNRPPTTEKENDICVVCFQNYKDGNNLCSFTFGHNFHFACIDQWICTKKSYPVYKKVIYDANLIKKLKRVYWILILISFMSYFVL